MRFLRPQICLAALMLFACYAPLCATGQEVILIVSEGSQSYSQAGDSAESYLKRSKVKVTRVTADGKIPSTQNGTYLAIGATALDRVLTLKSSQPVVHAMVMPRNKVLVNLTTSQAKRTQGIPMSTPLNFRLKFIHNIAPEIKKVGILYDPRVGTEEIKQLKSFAESFDMTIIAVPVRKSGDVPDAARLLFPKIDAFLAIPDPVVFTPANARTLMLMSLRAKRPFFSFSRNYVQHGAVAAFAKSPTIMGHEAAELAANGYLKDRSSSVQGEQHIEYFVNTKSAARMGIDLSPEVLRKASGVYP